MLIIFIFVCGLFAGNLIKWFALQVPNKDIKNLKKGVFRYTKKLFNKRIILGILTGLFYSMLYLRYRISIDFFKYCFIGSILLLIAIVDYKTKYVCFSTVLVATLLNFIFILAEFFYGVDVRTYVMGAVFALVVSAILGLIKVWGWGDVEVFVICGLMLGLNKVVIVLCIAICMVGILGIYLMIKKRKILIEDRVAFVPFILAALLIIII